MSTQLHGTLDVMSGSIEPSVLQANSGTPGPTTWYRGDGAWGAGGPGTTLFALDTPNTLTANTTAKQTFAFSPTGNDTILSNTLAVGDVLIFKGQLAYTSSSGTPPTVTPELDLNGTSVASAAAFSPPASAAGFYADFEILATVLTIGSSGTIRFDGYFGFETVSDGTYVKTPVTSAVQTVDTTADQTVTAAIAYSSATGGNSIALNQFFAITGGGMGGSGGGVQVVTSLPTPSIATQGNLYLLKENGASDDQLWLGIQRPSGYFLSEISVQGVYFPFLPTNLPGVVWWLDANAILGLSNGDPVSSWTDLSSNGFTPSQSNASFKPSYQTNVLNGLPVVRFSNSGACWLEVGSSPLTSNQGYTIFQVAINNTPSSSSPMAPVWIGGNAVSSGQGFLLYNANNAEWVYNPLGGSAFVAGSAAPSGAKKFTTSYSAGTIAIWENGTALSSGSTSAYNVGSASAIIGSNSALASGFCPTPNTDYAEVIIYDRVLTSTERGLVESYLLSKWGV